MVLSRTSQPAWKRFEPARWRRTEDGTSKLAWQVSPRQRSPANAAMWRAVAQWRRSSPVGAPLLQFVLQFVIYSPGETS